jgi:hypothetical protein
MGFGSRASSSFRFRASGFGSWVSGLMSQLSGLEFQVSGSGPRVSNLRFRASGLGGTPSQHPQLTHPRRPAARFANKKLPPRPYSGPCRDSNPRPPRFDGARNLMATRARNLRDRLLARACRLPRRARGSRATAERERPSMTTYWSKFT